MSIPTKGKLVSENKYGRLYQKNGKHYLWIGHTCLGEIAPFYDTELPFIAVTFTIKPITCMFSTMIMAVKFLADNQDSFFQRLV